MVFFSELILFAAILYLIKVFLYPYYRPVGNKQKKRIRSHQKLMQKKNRDAKIKAFKQRIANQYGRYLISEAKRRQLKKDLERLNKMESPEEIRVEQILYALAGIITSIVIFKVNTVMGYVSCIFILLGWLYPVDEIEKAISKKNKSIAKDFPSFYSMVYYQYSKTVNIYLADVIRDYLPNANPYMAEELGCMLDNMEYGEEFALKQLKKRVPIHYIIKFCDIMETRLKGYDNTSQMAYLKEEIDRFRIMELEKELQKRQEANSRIQMILIIVLGVYIFIYYLYMIIDAMEMFQ